MLQDALPERAGELTTSQRAFLHQLADRLPGVVWEDSALQTAVFDVARLTPIAPAQAFKALYRVLLDRDSGPKAGNLLAFLDRDFLLKRLQELPYDQQAFWQETAISREDFDAWTAEHRAHITQLTAEAKLDQARPEASAQLGIVEYTVAFDDSKTHLRRVLLGEFTEPAAFDAAMEEYSRQLQKKSQLLAS